MELGSGGGTSYPDALDTDTVQEEDSVSVVRYKVPNDLAAAIVAIETSLGTDPAGSLTDVKTRLAIALENDGTVKHSHLLSEGVSRLKSGNYTGDGTEDQAITGVGFAPKWVWIWVDDAGSDTSWERAGWTVDKTFTQGAGGAHSFNTDEIISLDADGFSVDDAAGDSHPNTNTEVYYYIALG